MVASESGTVSDTVLRPTRWKTEITPFHSPSINRDDALPRKVCEGSEWTLPEKRGPSETLPGRKAETD